MMSLLGLQDGIIAPEERKICRRKMKTEENIEKNKKKRGKYVEEMKTEKNIEKNIRRRKKNN